MKVLVLTAALSLASGLAGAKTVRTLDREVFVREPNYDETKIAPYALEDPLTFLDGRKVTKENWAERRKEILGVFAKEMYGEEPPAPESVVTELVDEKVTVAGYAIRRQYRMWFKADRSGPCVNWIVWIPRHAKKPVPVISFLNYRGNHELVPDEDIPVMTAWSRARDKAPNHRATEKTRGDMQNPNNANVFPIGMILARGYAVMSACYCEISPDPDIEETEERYRQERFAYTGVFGLWGRRDPARNDNTTALGAWGWALSRGLDLAERIPEIDAKKSVVTGCSRLGKSALLAAARDERFAVCVPNQTGGGGVPLAKRDFGENVSTENRTFTHWYCTSYAKYAEDPAKTLTFDQHLFCACVAPRALLVEGFGSPWFDTKGEYLALQAASPVWELLCGKGLPAGEWPDEYDTSAVGERLGYVRRSESHGISAYDWMWMMDFADRAFGPEWETRRLQRAIDAAATAGGGRVSVSPGEHLVGQIELQSNVELHLEKGAVLRGAVGLRHYRPFALPHSEGVWSAILVGRGVTNVAVTGEGLIWGDGTAWPQPADYGNGQEGNRARGLFFADSRDIRLEGFSLKDAACWGIVFKCCDGVRVRGLTIDTHANANNDGLDIEARNVIIADCDIDSGDDAVCIKSNDPNFAVENVLVTNVTARSNCACFKLGTASHGIMRNISFVDCRAAAPRRDFADRRNLPEKPAGAGWFYSPWRSSVMPPTRPGDLLSANALAVECVDGGLVENIRFRDVDVRGTAVPIFVRGGTRRNRCTGTPPGRWHVLRDVVFENIIGEALSAVPSSITGVEGCRVQDVTLRNVKLMMPGGGETAVERTRPVPEFAERGPGVTMFEQMLPAYGLWARHVDGLRIENVEIQLSDGTFDRRERFVLDDVTEKIR